jgi:YesN/AraC family two-component response regulator
MAMIYFETHQNDASEKLFRHILDMNDAEAFNSHIIAMRCQMYLAKIYERKKIYYRVLAECRRALSYKFNETDGVIAKEYRAEVKSVLKRVSKQYRIER